MGQVVPFPLDRVRYKVESYRPEPVTILLMAIVEMALARMEPPYRLSPATLMATLPIHS
jgi:hypothetical protein